MLHCCIRKRIWNRQFQFGESSEGIVATIWRFRCNVSLLRNHLWLSRWRSMHEQSSQLLPIKKLCHLPPQMLQLRKFKPPLLSNRCHLYSAHAQVLSRRKFWTLTVMLGPSTRLPSIWSRGIWMKRRSHRNRPDGCRSGTRTGPRQQKPRPEITYVH